jgi:TatD DNase family protein
MRLVDTHSHIHGEEYRSDLPAVLDRARAAGVERIVTLGVNRADSEQAVALARRHPKLIVAAAGVHPHDAKDATEADLDALEEMGADTSVALIGEIGLDFYRNLSPHEQQEKVMRRQLATARRLGKPVAVHVRDAHGAMLPILEEFSRACGGQLPDGRPLGVMHYFSGDAATAARYVELGFMISAHTSITHPKRTDIRDAVRATPLDRLVVETDSPYGAPQAHRGKRNEPAYVAEAAKAVGEARGISTERAAEATTANALRLLGLRVMTGERA